MYQSITKKLTLWVAFLSLLLLAGCSGKQEETTVAQSEAATETAKQEVSLDGKWKIYNLRESLESILIYTNPVNQLDGLLIMLIGAEKTTIASELTINGNTAEYHGAYDMNISFEAYYDTEFKNQNISKEEGLKRYQSYVELLFKNSLMQSVVFQRISRPLMERLKTGKWTLKQKPLLSLPQFSLQVTYEQQLLFSATNLSHIHIQSKMIF